MQTVFEVVVDGSRAMQGYPSPGIQPTPAEQAHILKFVILVVVDVVVVSTLGQTGGVTHATVTDSADKRYGLSTMYIHT